MPCIMDARVQRAYTLPPYIHSKRTDVLMVTEGDRKLEIKGKNHGTIPPSPRDLQLGGHGKVTSASSDVIPLVRIFNRSAS